MAMRAASLLPLLLVLLVACGATASVSARVVDPNGVAAAAMRATDGGHAVVDATGGGSGATDAPRGGDGEDGEDERDTAATDHIREANRRLLDSVYHKDHEHLHLAITLGLLVFFVASQVALWWWKTYHTRSFKLVTLLGVWLMPVGFCVVAGPLLFWRMILLWLAFTAATARVVYLSTRRPLGKDTPRIVYRFFLTVYNVSHTVALSGYVLLIIEFVGIQALFPFVGIITYYGVLLIFYGLYYGLLDRDFAELCADQMASRMGYYGAKGLPSASIGKRNACAICSQPLRAPPSAIGADGGADAARALSSGGAAGADGARGGDDDDDDDEERTYTLSCKHSFHESCLRGWVIVGKKDTCSACAEKVRLTDVFQATHPWLRTSQVWVQCLDALRHLLVWNPLIIVVAQLCVVLVDR